MSDTAFTSDPAIEEDEVFFIDGSEGDYTPGVDDLDPEDGPLDVLLVVIDFTFVDVETWLAGHDVDSDYEDDDEDDLDNSLDNLDDDDGEDAFWQRYFGN